MTGDTKSSGPFKTDSARHTAMQRKPDSPVFRWSNRTYFRFWWRPRVQDHCVYANSMNTTNRTNHDSEGFRVPLFIVALVVLAIGAINYAQAAPTFQTAGTAVSGTGAVSPAWPAHAIGDVALLFIESTGGEPATLSSAQGFAAVANSPQATGTTTNGTQITVYWARATTTSMAAPTIADPGDHVYAQIITYRGVIGSGNPWDVTGGGVKATSSSSVTVTGVTTTLPSTLVVQVASRANDRSGTGFTNETNANLTGIAERSDGGTTSGNGGGFAVWDGAKATAGATGNTTASLTRSSTNAFLTIVLKSASTLHHIRIEHDGVASSCAPEPITLKACVDAACTAPFYTSTDVTGINLSPTSAGYTWSPGSTVSIAAAGGGISVGSITLARNSNGSATLAITGTPSPAPASGYECYNTATNSSGDCNLTYSGNFSFNVLDHTSATRQVVALTSCTSNFANQTRAVKFWSTYVNPNAGTLQGAVVAGTGNADCATGYSALGTNSGAATTLNLAFGPGTSPQATFSLCYPDVGQVQVDTRYDGSIANGDNGVAILGNDNFVAKPDHFAVSNIKRTSDNLANPGAATTSDAVFIKAGDATTAVARFTATVTAKNALNATAPNFGIESTPESIKVTSVLVAPVAGSAGVLTCNASNTNCVVPGGPANFSGGATTITDLAWNEVGIIQLRPDLNDGNYLGTGVLTTPTVSANVGRFYPDHLAVVAGSASLQARSDIMAPAACVVTAQSDVGDISSGTSLLSITDATPFVVGDGVVVVGAGAGGADLYTTVTATDIVNDTLTLASSAAATVTGATVFQRARMTYMGEPMLLSFDVQALNAVNAITTNYNSAAGFSKLTAANVTGLGANNSWGLWGTVNQLYGVNGCRALFATASPFGTTYSPAGCVSQPAAGYTATAARVATTGTPTASWVAGVGTLTTSVVVNSANTPDGIFSWLGLGALPQDLDGVLTTTTKDFDTDSTAGKDRVRVGVAEIRLGRLKLDNANGSELLPLPVPLGLQYWQGTGWQSNPTDTCTAVAASDFAFAFPAGNATKANNLAACETAITVAGSAPSYTVSLSAPGAGNDGWADLTLNLGASAAGNRCTTVGGVGSAATTSNAPWLTYNWTGTLGNPTARATFGVFKSGPVIFRREKY